MEYEAAPVVTLDGPSGSGKGAVGQYLCQRLLWHYLDSGAIYRILALAAKRANIDGQHAALIAQIVKNLNITYRFGADNRPHIYLDMEDVSDLIRTEAVAKMASSISVFPPIRDALNQYFQCFRRLPGLVADGRDMGSVVFPDALVKIFLDAKPEIRAQRRYKQLKEKGIDVNLSNIYTDILLRDARDRNRKIAPLQPSIGATVIDTSAMALDQVVDKVCSLVEVALTKLDS